jgi:hypothetical protein
VKSTTNSTDCVVLPRALSPSERIAINRLRRRGIERPRKVDIHFDQGACFRMDRSDHRYLAAAVRSVPGRGH